MKVSTTVKGNILSLLGIMSVILLIVVAISLSLFVLSHFGVVELPQGIKDLFGGKEDPRIFGDEGALYEALANKRAQDGIELSYSIDKELFASVLSDIDLPQEYFVQNTVQYVGPNMTLEKRYLIYVMGERFRVIEYNGDELLQSYVCDGSTVYVVNADGSYKSSSNIQLYDPAVLGAITPISMLSDDGARDIAKAQNELASLYSVRIDKSSSEYEYLYVSPAYGMVLGAELYRDGKCAVRAIITDLKTDLSSMGIGESFFEFRG